MVEEGKLSFFSFLLALAIRPLSDSTVHPPCPLGGGGGGPRSLLHSAALHSLKLLTFRFHTLSLSQHKDDSFRHEFCVD